MPWYQSARHSLGSSGCIKSASDNTVMASYRSIKSKSMVGPNFIVQNCRGNGYGNFRESTCPCHVVTIAVTTISVGSPWTVLWIFLLEITIGWVGFSCPVLGSLGQCHCTQVRPVTNWATNHDGSRSHQDQGSQELKELDCTVLSLLRNTISSKSVFQVLSFSSQMVARYDKVASPESWDHDGN